MGPCRGCFTELSPALQKMVLAIGTDQQCWDSQWNSCFTSEKFQVGEPSSIATTGSSDGAVKKAAKGGILLTSSSAHDGGVVGVFTSFGAALILPTLTARYLFTHSLWLMSGKVGAVLILLLPFLL